METIDPVADELRQAVEALPSQRTVPRRPFWEGVVHLLDLEGHPRVTRAYAWSSPVEASEKGRFFAVLQPGAIKSPVDAVRASIGAEHRAAK